MKHLILIATIITSTNTLLTMEQAPLILTAEKTCYEQMLDVITNSSMNKPSITIINNDKLAVGLYVNDTYRTSGIDLHVGSQLTFSPCAYPFCLDEKEITNGAVVRLNIDPQHRINPYISNSIIKYYLDLHIGGKSNIKFGDTISVNHNDDNNTIAILHNKTLLKILQTTGVSIPLGLAKPARTIRTKRFIKKTNSVS